MLSEPAFAAAQDQKFLRWIMGDVNGASSAAGAGGLPLHQISQSPVELVVGSGYRDVVGLPVDDPASATALTYPSPLLFTGGRFNQKAQHFGHGISNIIFPPVESLALPLFLQGSMAEKSLLSGSNHLLSLQQQILAPPNPSFFPSTQITATSQENMLLRSPLKRQEVHPFPDNRGSAELFFRQNQTQQQQQSLVDQLLKVAELVETGNFVMILEILARLNQQLPSPVGKPLLRSAFYFKEDLQLLATKTPMPPPLATPLDVVLELGAYKNFSDGSPVCQFTNFTCVQVLLEELGNADRIHIIDFDIGVGGQWSSFMQELAQRRRSDTTAGPGLKITPFTTSFSHHRLELHLTRDNLRHFAEDLNISFEFNVLNFDQFDHELLLRMLAGADEAIVVKLPLGSSSYPPVPTLLRFVKQLSPNIIASFERGKDCGDLPFAQHFFHALQSCTVLLDSIEAAGANHYVTSKIERFMVQPWAESLVLGRYLAGERMLSWRALFASAGFVPVQFSNFTETQAECLLKRVQVRGFHIEKRQASLSLFWQSRELVSVSAWKC